jgi:hypothetical protein
MTIIKSIDLILQYLECGGVKMSLINYTKYKYNPNEMDKKAFLDRFVVRNDIFKEIYEDIKTTDYSVPSQHFIIVGQRGQGKTTLLRKIFLEIRQDEQLSKFLLPIQFAEEQYQIRSLCRLWEEVAEYLESVYKDEFGAILDTMEKHFEDDDYEFNCFSYLEKQIKAKGKKIILLVDNIDELFGKLKEKETRQLREILLTSSTFKIVGGSTKMFEQHYDYAKPFYEFFKIIKLRGLTSDETLHLLRVIAKGEQKDKIENIINTHYGKIETLRQLTGGVPRTLVMLFDIFIDDNGNAFDDLIKVLDEATPLYKHRMDDLPPVLQDIVHTLALNWDGMLTKDIALKTKLQSKEVSAQLKQLEKYQIVESVSIGKNNIYKIEERFFNIWYLMRYGRKKDRNRVEWLVRFLCAWYSKDEKSYQTKQTKEECQSGDYMAVVLLWNEEFSKSYEKFEEWLEYEKALESIDDISDYLTLLISKGQYYKAKEFFENEKYQLKDRVKPIWYALMKLMEKDFPNEIKKMGDELRESVDGILKSIENMKNKYKI